MDIKKLIDALEYESSDSPYVVLTREEADAISKQLKLMYLTSSEHKGILLDMDVVKAEHMASIERCLRKCFSCDKMIYSFSEYARCHECNMILIENWIPGDKV